MSTTTPRVLPAAPPPPAAAAATAASARHAIVAWLRSGVTQTAGSERMPRWLAAFPVAYLAVLGVVATMWTARWPGPELFQIPLAVVWFGALGGVVASLQGMFAHNRHWQPSHNLWHALSGVTGAADGLVSYLILLVVIKAAAGPAADAPTVFELAAFALGYAQREFHAMMMQIFGILFQTSNGQAAPTPTPTPPAAGTGAGITPHV